MHNYHDASMSLPFASTNVPRHTFVPSLWPYIDQTPLYSRWDFSLHFHQAPNIVTNSMDSPGATMVPLYYCPSNTGTRLWTADSFYRVRINYFVNRGNAASDSLLQVDSKAPFGFNRAQLTHPFSAKFSNFTDGMSNTMLMSEMITPNSPSESDARGDVLNDDISSAAFGYSTRFTPNPNPEEAEDHTFSCPGPPGKILNAPCSNVGPYYMSARSLHVGGVHTLMADGAVRFISANIALDTWQALGTMQGDEVIGEF